LLAGSGGDAASVEGGCSGQVAKIGTWDPSQNLHDSQIILPKWFKRTRSAYLRKSAFGWSLRATSKAVNHEHYLAKLSTDIAAEVGCTFVISALYFTVDIGTFSWYKAAILGSIK